MKMPSRASSASRMLSGESRHARREPLGEGGEAVDPRERTHQCSDDDDRSRGEEGDALDDLAHQHRVRHAEIAMQHAVHPDLPHRQHTGIDRGAATANQGHEARIAQPAQGEPCQHHSIQRPGSGIINSPLGWGDQLDGPSPIAATRSWQRTSPALVANKSSGGTMVTLHSLQCIGMGSDYDVLAVFLRSTAKNFSGQPCIVRYPATVTSPGRSCPGHPGGRGIARCRAQAVCPSCRSAWPARRTSRSTSSPGAPPRSRAIPPRWRPACRTR